MVEVEWIKSDQQKVLQKYPQITQMAADFFLSSAKICEPTVLRCALCGQINFEEFL